MLKLYSFYHLNLMYSSIEETERKKVIETCYWPLLNLVEKGYPIGIEAPALTLELIYGIDKTWIERFSILLKQKKCELIGSGYAQIIGPLVPARLNEWNQRLGRKIYSELLGVSPEIALVNEMSYSSGLLEHYIKAGYKAVIMEWNNPRKFHPEWPESHKYFCQRAVANDGSSVPLMWAESIGFQKFQRYAHGEIGLEKLCSYLETHDKHGGYFPLYSNDVEIFDFRPGRYKTEAKLPSLQSEWGRIFELYSFLGSHPKFKFVLPGEVLNSLNMELGGKLIKLESAKQPIPVKKQEKYNINRWAITGRDDLGINTRCYNLCKTLNLANADEKQWKELCFLWSSDFRTHITENRWFAFNERLLALEKLALVPQTKDKSPDPTMAKLEVTGDYPLKIGAFALKREGNFINVQGERIHVRFNHAKGMTIDSLAAKDISDQPFLGTLEHGYYEDIGLGADFYSGHLLIDKPGKAKMTDLWKSEVQFDFSDGKLFLHSSGQTEDLFCEKTIGINERELFIEKKIVLKNRALASITPISITFLPEAWDQDSMFFQVHNGGKDLETFHFGKQDIDHAEFLSPQISAKSGLGATEGTIVLGDRQKTIRFEHETSMAALIPSFKFIPLENNNFFLRLKYSAQEWDETFRSSDVKQEIKMRLRIVC